MSADRSVRVPPHVHAREFAGELVILDMARGKYFSLDAIGARAFGGLARGETPSEVVAAITSEYDVSPAQALADIEALVDDLLAKGLLELADRRRT
jgi:hypothetical protein